MADALSRNTDGNLPECDRDHVICVLQSNRPSGYAPHELAFLQQVDSQLRKIFVDLRYPNPGKKPTSLLFKEKSWIKRMLVLVEKFLLVSPLSFVVKFSVVVMMIPMQEIWEGKILFARVSERYWWPKMFVSVMCLLVYTVS